MLQYFIDPDKCLPDYHARRVQEFDLNSFQAAGYRVLLFDIDNTLVDYDSDYPEADIQAFLECAKERFDVALLSNNHKRRITPLAKSLGIPAVHHARKPLKSGFRRALKQVAPNARPESVLVVGDQVMTDIYGAKRSGFDAALVHPLRPGSERWYTRLNRWLERRMLRRVEKAHPERFEALKLKARDA